MTSEFNSVTSITYVDLSLGLLLASVHLMKGGEASAQARSGTRAIAIALCGLTGLNVEVGAASVVVVDFKILKVPQCSASVASRGLRTR